MSKDGPTTEEAVAVVDYSPWTDNPQASSMGECHRGPTHTCEQSENESGICGHDVGGHRRSWPIRRVWTARTCPGSERGVRNLSLLKLRAVALALGVAARELLPGD
jgi:hypothetical protein